MTRRKGALLITSIFAFMVFQLLANYYRSNFDSVKDCAIDCDKEFIASQLLYSNINQALAITAIILFIVLFIKYRIYER